MIIIALADTEWKYGRLIDKTKELALEIIKNKSVLKFYEEDKKFYKARELMLEKVKERLESPQPEMKKIHVPRIYKCEWKINDVYAYKLESEYAKEQGFYGRYLLFIKVDETTWYPGHIIPIVWVKITKDDKLPNNIDEINKLEFIQIDFYSYETLAVNVGFNYRYETANELVNRLYPTDKYGLLPIYRSELLSTSKRIIPKKLIYLGNYENIIPPVNEYLSFDIIPVNWKNVEERYIKFYFDNNKGKKIKYFLKRFNNREKPFDMYIDAYQKMVEKYHKFKENS